MLIGPSVVLGKHLVVPWEPGGVRHAVPQACMACASVFLAMLLALLFYFNLVS